jgi:2-polyprenyl-3-methyl-5-hydroxy-6-metoxy-1,4-benzoquinol methylase
VVGLDANPEAHEHARLRYTRDRLSFERGLVESWGEPASFDVVVFLQTIEHVQDPHAVLSHVRELLADGGVAYVSTPNVLTLAAPGAERSGNPWHIREYRAGQFRILCEEIFDSVEIHGLHHAGKLALHELALRLGWDRVHGALRLTRPFYDRFVPAISTSDFVLREDQPAQLDRALDFLAVCR